MQNYATLTSAWSAATATPGSLPAGVTGTPFSAGMTTAQKIAAVNSWTVARAQKAIVPVYAIINAITPADFLALTSTQISQITLLFGGNQTVDASTGTTIRAVFQSIFAGKTTTLNQLGSLVGPYDNATLPWWGVAVASGGAGLLSSVGQPDCDAAGLV